MTQAPETLNMTTPITTTTNVLAQMSAKCRELGARRGETAKQFAARNPEAARQLADWTVEHRAALVSAVSARVSVED